MVLGKLWFRWPGYIGADKNEGEYSEVNNLCSQKNLRVINLITEGWRDEIREAHQLTAVDQNQQKNISSSECMLKPYLKALAG